MRALGTRYSGSYRPSGRGRRCRTSASGRSGTSRTSGPTSRPRRSTTRRSSLPTLYRNLLDAAWAALQATGHSRDTVLFGETARPARASTAGRVPQHGPVAVPAALYCVDSAFRPLRGVAAAQRGCPTDAAARPGSGARTRPCLRPADSQTIRIHRDCRRTRPHPDEPTTARAGGAAKLERTLDTLVRVYGSTTRFPIYSTEFGYQPTRRTSSPARSARAWPRNISTGPSTSAGAIPREVYDSTCSSTLPPATSHRTGGRQRNPEARLLRLPDADLPAGDSTTTVSAGGLGAGSPGAERETGRHRPNSSDQFNPAPEAPTASGNRHPH